MKFTAKVGNFEGNLWGHHIIVPKDVAEQFIEGKNRRVLCTLNGVLEFPCALMHKKGGEYFINLNKEIRKKLDLHQGMEVEASLVKDTSEFGMPVSEEFSAVLESDELGYKYFKALTPGKQRSLIYLVGKPKSTDIRIRKSIVVLEHLIEQKGKLDYQILNQDFKDKKNR